MADTTVTKIDSEHSPRGRQGQRYLASGKGLAMRLWENEEPGERKPSVRRDYETVGFVLAGRADQAGVTLAMEGGHTPVQGDPRRLKEALINIVANAIEATPNGGSVQLRVRNNVAGNVTLEVKDTGRGIAPDDLERLGTSFFTTRPNGTGLGVVLAQGVITQHGGSLAYTSTVGRGTTATITLPGKPATTATTTTPEPAPRAAMIEARA